MEKAAQVILLRLAALQAEKPPGDKTRCSYTGITHPDFEVDVKVGSYKLLAELVGTSYRLGGQLAEEVWRTLRKRCDYEDDGTSSLQSEFEVDGEDFIENLVQSDCSPLNELAAEIFAHIGLPFSIPDDFHSSPIAVDEDVEAKAAALLMVLKRDGTCCPLTGTAFYGHGIQECLRNDPIFTHIIPASVLAKPESIHCIQLLTGTETLSLIQHLATTKDDTSSMNAIALETHASDAFKQGLLGIEHVNMLSDLASPLLPGLDFNEDSYVVRLIVPELAMSKPGLQHLFDGANIHFGRGLSDPEASPVDEHHQGRLNYPHPLLCNLRYEISCALQESGVRDLIARLMEEASQPLESPVEEIVIPLPHSKRLVIRHLTFLGAESASERVRRMFEKGRSFGVRRDLVEKDDRTHFCEVLSAKLMICGRAAVMI